MELLNISSGGLSGGEWRQWDSAVNIGHKKDQAVKKQNGQK